jgi:Xaa-Pro aminopeptidase
MLSCCARNHGQVARLSRSVSFGAAPAAQDELLRLESTGLDAVRAGQSLAAVYHAFDAAYRHANRPDALRERPQGGIAGYLACELAASPSTATGLETGMAFAFNPGFDGIGIEDTFLLGANGLENLTLDPQWPAANIGGRMRPRWLELT